MDQFLVSLTGRPNKKKVNGKWVIWAYGLTWYSTWRQKIHGSGRSLSLWSRQVRLFKYIFWGHTARVMKQKQCRNSAQWLIPGGLFSLLGYIIDDYLYTGRTSYSGLGTSITCLENLHSLTHRVNLQRHFLFFSLSNKSSLCQTDKTKWKTNQPELLNACQLNAQTHHYLTATFPFLFMPNISY